MGKGEFIQRISAAWVAVFVLFFGAPALAVTTTCTFTNALGSGNVTLTTVPASSGDWPVYNSSGPSWDYKYILTSPTSTPTPPLGTNPSVDFLIPVCSPSLSISGATVYPAGNPPGAGSRFGSWTGHDNVVRVQGLLGTGGYSITFSTPELLPLRDTSAGLVTGTTTSSFICKDIVAPICPGGAGLAFQPVTINTCMIVEGKNVLIVRNQNHCISEIWDCGNNAGCPGGTGGEFCTKLAENVEVVVTCAAGVDPSLCKNQDAITAGDILGNQICPEAILFSASSPGCSNVRTLSGWVQVCR